jgi:hypothetical protein
VGNKKNREEGKEIVRGEREYETVVKEEDVRKAKKSKLNVCK